jgi:radical SAM protein with 4Fe4S-binding SPASM domain
MEEREHSGDWMRGIFWEITSRCNLRCKHCYLHDELTPPHEPFHDELTTEECLQVVDQLDEVKAFYVTVLGGEPFARPDILRILHHLGSKKCWTRIDTNGTLIDETTARALSTIKIKGMNISLEGADAKTNDSIRGEGSFEKTVRGITYLADFGIPFRIGMTVNKMNYTEIERMAKFSYTMKAEAVNFAPYVDFPHNPFSEALNLGREEFFTAARMVERVKGEFPKAFISSDLQGSLSFLSPKPDDGKVRNLVNCGLGATQLVILSNGDVIPCTYMRDIVIGNVRKTSLARISSSAAFESIRELRKITVDEANENCRKCSVKHICCGGCRGRAYLMYGDLLAPDPQKCLLRGEVHG